MAGTILVTKATEILKDEQEVLETTYTPYIYA